MSALAKFLKKFAGKLSEAELSGAEKIGTAINKRGETWELVNKLAKSSPKEAKSIEWYYRPKINKNLENIDDAFSELMFKDRAGGGFGSSVKADEAIKTLSDGLTKKADSSYREFLSILGGKFKGREPK